MNKERITKVVLIILAAANNFLAGCHAESSGYCPPDKAEANEVEAVLEQLKQKTKELKSYQCRIEYLFSQPLFESETLRKGTLSYEKAGRKSKLRINFKTLKQDDEKEQKYKDEYIFDGQWLTHIDYQIKEVKRYEQSEPNKPFDAFDLVSRDFPVIGFTKIENLKKQFEIRLIQQPKGKPEKFIYLHLKVKPDSIYKDDYTSIDFWIDKELYLPAKIVAISTEPTDVPPAQKDSFQIKFVQPKVDKKLDKKVFEFRIPKGFTVEITSLDERN